MDNFFVIYIMCVMRFFITSILVLIGFSCFSQTLIKGKVTDEKNTTLPGVTILVPKTTIGTITNRDGVFQIKLPKNYKQIQLSSIGYKTQIVNISSNKYLHIKLPKEVVKIPEIMVMPKDSLLAMLYRAYGKIKDNYAPTPTKLNGFYRESYYAPKKDTYLYYGEALVKVFKTSYKNKADGQVEVLQSRMNKHPMYDSLSRTMWYGGLHFPISEDIVKHRDFPIHPKAFKSRDYTIYKTTLDGIPAYKIEYKAKKGWETGYQGCFYLDRKTLAYLYFEEESTKYGTELRNKSLKSNIVSKGRKSVVKYLKGNKFYYLAYVSDKEYLYDTRTKQEVEQISEYITLNLDTAKKAIPFNKQVQRTDIFYLKANDYKESAWKDKAGIAPDSALQKLLVYNNQTSDSLLNKKYKLPKSYSRKQKLFKIVSKIYSDFDFSIHTLSNIPNSKVIFNPDDTNTFTGEINSSNLQAYSYAFRVGYELTPQWDISWIGQECFNRHYSELNALGVAFKTPLINRGRQLLLNLGVDFYSREFGWNIGEFKSTKTFRADSKKFDARKIALAVGTQSLGMQLRAGLQTRLSAFTHLFAEANYAIDFNTKHRLFIMEKSGFFLFRKIGSIPLSDKRVQYFENNVLTNKSTFSPDKFSFKLGIRFAI